MSSRRSVPQPASPGHDLSEERSRLASALRSAGLDASAPFDDTRTVLMARLMRHSDDYAATGALTALDRFTAEQRADAHSGAPDRLLRQGQSGTSAARRWLHLGKAG